MIKNLIKSKIKRLPLNKAEIDAEIISHLKGRKTTNTFVEVEIVGQGEMKRLNFRFMKKDYPTDVLSFPLTEIPGETSAGERHIGTIVLCNDIIKLNAKKSEKIERDEFILVLRHGLDHLLGIHHN